MRLIEPIPIELDKPRTLLLDLRALAMAEREIAKLRAMPHVSLLKIVASGEVGVNETIVIAWAALMHEEPALTLDRAMALFSGIRYVELIGFVTRMINEHLGMRPREAGDASDPQMPQSGNGSNSGALRDMTSASPAGNFGD